MMFNNLNLIELLLAQKLNRHFFDTWLALVLLLGVLSSSSNINANFG